MATDELNQLFLEVFCHYWLCLSTENIQKKSFKAFVTSIDDYTLNLAVVSQDQHQDALLALHDIQNFYKAHRVQWAWWTNASTQFAQQLKAHQLELEETSPYFCLNLANFSSNSTESYPIKEIQTLSEFKDWSALFEDAFDETQEGTRAYSQLFSRQFPSHASQWTHRLLYFNEEPAALVTLFRHTNQAFFIANVGTAKKFRHRGLAFQLLQSSLQYMKQHKGEYCFLEASQAGVNLYKRLGFQELGQASLYRFKTNK